MIMANVTNLEKVDSLDNLTATYFEILQELLDERHKLELSMRGGFLEMAKSRLNMGSRSVSSIQLPSPTSDKCYSADFKVETSTQKEDLIETMHFHLLKCANDGSVTAKHDSGGLRKRVLGGQSTEQSAEEIRTSDGDIPIKEKTVVKSSSLNWFGILLPNSLRSSKDHFQSSLHTICKIASLQISLLRIQNDYQKLTE